MAIGVQIIQFMDGVNKFASFTDAHHQKVNGGELSTPSNCSSIFQFTFLKIHSIYSNVQICKPFGNKHAITIIFCTALANSLKLVQFCYFFTNERQF